MVFDIRSIDIVLANLAKRANSEEPSDAEACRCGSNEFMSFVRRATALADTLILPERYEWASELMLAARSPHAYVSLPVAIPMSTMEAGGTTRFSSRFATDSDRRYTYTPFAAFVSALALSLELNFESPAMFYAPSLNRQPHEMESVGWYAGTPILAVHSKPIMSAVAAGRVLDKAGMTSEVKAATAETMADGALLTAVVHRKVSDALGGSRLPFMDCLADSRPYIVLGYADHVRVRLEWTANGVTVRRARLASSAFPPPLVPPGYILARLHRLKKGQWSVEVDYEKERYESGVIETLTTSAEGYLRQLLG
jgi:hypothetical protein